MNIPVASILVWLVRIQGALIVFMSVWYAIAKLCGWVPTDVDENVSGLVIGVPAAVAFGVACMSVSRVSRYGKPVWPAKDKEDHKP